jgi:hypothetical protein
MQTELKPKRIPYGIQGFEMLRNDVSLICILNQEPTFTMI